MSVKPIDLSCDSCGSNRLHFPATDDGLVTCEDCGSNGRTLSDVKLQVAQQMADAPEQAERLSRKAGKDQASLRERHLEEVEESQADLRESVAETDRLVVQSDEMHRRHLRERDAERS